MSFETTAAFIHVQVPTQLPQGADRIGLSLRRAHIAVDCGSSEICLLPYLPPAVSVDVENIGSSFEL